MKGFRFYLEYGSPKKKRNNQDDGNVIAVFLDDSNCPIWFTGSFNQMLSECISAVFFCRNSDVCSCSVSEKYLRTCTKRISETKAREIHPKLFEYLEM